jgi:hypothetical protein
MSTFAQELNKNIVDEIVDNNVVKNVCKENKDTSDETSDINLQDEVNNENDSDTSENIIELPQEPKVKIEYIPIEKIQNKQILPTKNAVISHIPIQKQNICIKPKTQQATINNSQVLQKIETNKNNTVIPMKHPKAVRFGTSENKNAPMQLTPASINPEKILQTVCVSGSLLSTVQKALHASSSTFYFLVILLCVGFALFMHQRKINNS